jgi:hypothetical protein
LGLGLGGRKSLPHRQGLSVFWSQHSTEIVIPSLFVGKKQANLACFLTVVVT